MNGLSFRSIILPGLIVFVHALIMLLPESHNFGIPIATTKQPASKRTQRDVRSHRATEPNKIKQNQTLY